MILVDIYVPSFDKEYDFNLDEKTKISVVLEEIAEIISQKEQCEMKGKISDLMLCSFDKKSILQRDKTLENCEIHTGNRLILL